MFQHYALPSYALTCALTWLEIPGGVARTVWGVSPPEQMRSPFSQTHQTCRIPVQEVAMRSVLIDSKREMVKARGPEPRAIDHPRVKTPFKLQSSQGLGPNLQLELHN